MKTYQWALAIAYISLRWYVIEKLGTLAKPYLAYKLSKRKGKCLRCGKCCYSRRKIRYCNHMGYGNTCRIWKQDNFPTPCRYFPLDKLNLKVWDHKCGYYFK